MSNTDDTKPRVLVVEDGHEYIRTLSRFLSEDALLVRAGCGAEALALLAARDFDVIFQDMRFDRVPAEQLLGDEAALRQRFGGDAERTRRFLEDNQGTFILAAVRAAGVRLPVVFSYDFDGEPRRFRNLEQQHGPLRYVTDNASPKQILALFVALAGG